jgi:hypothetical protein
MKKYINGTGKYNLSIPTKVLRLFRDDLVLLGFLSGICIDFDDKLKFK